MKTYILKGKKPVLCEDRDRYVNWFETANRKVALTVVKTITVSTVFLGLDHNFLGNGEPQFFETMIFGGKHDEYQERYATWDEAEAGHKRAVELVL